MNIYVRVLQNVIFHKTEYLAVFARLIFTRFS